MFNFLRILIFQLSFVSLIHSQWNSIYTSPSSYQLFFQSIYFTSENTGYTACGDSAIFKTTNGGLNWLRLNGTSNYNLTDLQFTSINIGYAIGANIAPNIGYLLKTTNSGQNWSVQTFNYYFSSLKFINDNTGYITTVGDTVNSIILKTTNAGLSWSSQSLEAGYLSMIDFVDSNFGFVNAVYGKFFKTSNGGNNWLSYYTTWLNTFDFINENLGFAVGIASFGSNIYKTTNGGINWVNIYAKDSVFLGKPVFIDGNTGWIGGFKLKSNNIYNRIILKTTNSGINWFEQSSGTQSDSNSCIASIFILNADIGYASTMRCQFQNEPALNAMVFKTTNGGGEPIGINNHGSIIKDFTLYQNYPNPFNPSTEIKYAIPQSNLVSIKIYNIEGELVEVLVCKYEEAGYYSIQFDGSNLSSGVYFYTIKAGNFSDTKKMVLVK